MKSLPAFALVTLSFLAACGGPSETSSTSADPADVYSRIYLASDPSLCIQRSVAKTHIDGHTIETPIPWMQKCGSEGDPGIRLNWDGKNNAEVIFAWGSYKPSKYLILKEGGRFSDFNWYTNNNASVIGGVPKPLKLIIQRNAAGNIRFILNPGPKADDRCLVLVPGTFNKIQAKKCDDASYMWKIKEACHTSGSGILCLG